MHTFMKLLLVWIGYSTVTIYVSLCTVLKCCSSRWDTCHIFTYIFPHLGMKHSYNWLFGSVEERNMWWGRRWGYREGQKIIFLVVVDAVKGNVSIQWRDMFNFCWGNIRILSRRNNHGMKIIVWMRWWQFDEGENDYVVRTKVWTMGGWRR